MSTVKSLSEMMKPDVVGTSGGCETCGNDKPTQVTRIAVETLAKLEAKKPAPETQPVQASKPAAQPAPAQGNKSGFTPHKK